MNRRMRLSVLSLALFFFTSGLPSARAEEKDGGPPAGDTPPGWTHGEKKGWGEEGMPPGLAKKSGEEGKKHKGKKHGKGKGKGKKH